MNGWICPKCGRVFGPLVTFCGPCNTLIDCLGPHPPDVRPQMTRDTHQQAFEKACEKEADKR